MKRFRTEIGEAPLDIGAALEEVGDPSCGGLALFVGTVRRSAAIASHHAKPVVRLDYEAHGELAPRRLDEICHEAQHRWDVRRLVALHRTGSCELGEATFVVACSAPHRADALEACRFVIDAIKSTVPIWKREVYEDGSSWVGAEDAAG